MRRALARTRREQLESPFARILADLIEAAPFIRGAALVDFEGETVDYAGELDPFELRVLAATLQLVVAEAQQARALGGIRQFSFRPESATGSSHGGFVVRLLDESYSVILAVRHLGTFVVSDRLLSETESRILREASLNLRSTPWHSIEVECDPATRRPSRVRRRPSRELGSAWIPVEVLGGLVKLGVRERGYRVRFETGAEMNLVCERERRWFIDEPSESVLDPQHTFSVPTRTAGPGLGEAIAAARSAAPRALE